MPPTKVANIPFGTGNPYQHMMYQKCGPEFILRGARNGEFATFGQPEFRKQHGIVHLHWDDRLFQSKDGLADSHILRFQIAHDNLSQFQDNGGRVIWTIHNQVAHSNPGEIELFRASRIQLTKLVDLIHVHTPHAKKHMIKEYNADPKKIRLIPHPSYLDVYEDSQITLNRPLPARNKTRFLTFGTMRGGRELNILHAAVAKLSRRGYDFRLHVAGKVFPANRRVIRQLQSVDTVDVTDTRIPNEDIPEVFAQAHAYVLPSAQTFTSGTAMLALSFGLPIIAPDTAAHRDTTPEACHDLLYQPHNARGLIRMLRHVMQMTDQELSEKRQACFDFATARHPENVSQMLANTLKELVGESGL